MNLITRAISWVSPGWAARRLRSQLEFRAYEAAMPSRTRAARKESRGANTAVFAAGASLREQARWLDENHDLAIGILDKLEERVVGARGIQVEPQPLTYEGKVHEEFAATLSALWEKWAESPDVTGLYTLAEAERLALRSALRDGEVFIQLINGHSPGLVHSTPVPFSFQMLEADFVPFSKNSADYSNTTVQGIDLNTWGRPLGYHVYRHHPQSGLGTTQTIRLPAERVLHLAIRKRLHQVRGVSLFHGVLSRLGEVKEYEDSELVTARIAASLGFWIKRGDASIWDDGGKDHEKPDNENRLFEMAPGMIYDGLAPGEELQMLESGRPNSRMADFRNGQLRAVAAGTRTGYSSISRDYNGTYSAQRQELVESFEGFAVLQDWFVARVARPLYRSWIQMLKLSGVEIPPDVDPDSLFDAIYMAPVMPWIDPQKESEAWKTQIRGGTATEAEWVRARGASPRAIKKQRMRELEFNRRHGLVFDTDPASDNGDKNAEQSPPSRSGKKSSNDPADGKRTREADE